MPNLYNKLMAKERGNIQDAPNKQRIGQAPLNLRSAMRYASGGISDSDIGSFVQQNIGNPAAIAQAAQTYQVTAEDLARATGYTPEQISTYFSSAGVSGPYTAPQQGVSPRQEEMAPPPPRPEEIAPPPPKYEEPMRPRREEPPRPPREEPPEIYPVDTALNSSDTAVQPTQPQTSYRQNADGTLTEIGYDGQPISGYTPEQTAMDRATRGLDPSEFQYVWNGQGYDKVRTGGITMDDGTFIAGVDNGQGGANVGTPEFFQNYADQPATMDLLRQMYGFTGDQPVYQEPQIGYNPVVEQVPSIGKNPTIELPSIGYNEPQINDQTPETLFDINKYRNNQQQESESERLNLLKKAIQGQGIGSLQESQKLAALLQSLGYSK